MSRSGRTREPTTSDHRPIPILIAAASACETAITAPPTQSKSPRSSCRNTTTKPDDRDLRQTYNPLAARHELQSRRSRSVRLDISWPRARAARARRGERATPTTAPTRTSAERNRNPERGSPRSGAADGAAISPPTGTAVCLTPSASPRSSRANQLRHRAAAAGLTLPPRHRRARAERRARRSRARTPHPQDRRHTRRDRRAERPPLAEAIGREPPRQHRRT